MVKEFGPTFSRGGNMAHDFLADDEIPALKGPGDAATKASVSKGAPHGLELGFQLFPINGRMFGCQVARNDENFSESHKALHLN
jgi:hypothetical protein